MWAMSAVLVSRLLSFCFRAFSSPVRWSSSPPYSLLFSRDMAFVEAYSNEQLQKALREYGINVPITPTSRKVCENKLKKLMGATNPQTDVRDDGDKPDDKEPTPKAIDEPINFVSQLSRLLVWIPMARYITAVWLPPLNVTMLRSLPISRIVILERQVLAILVARRESCTKSMFRNLVTPPRGSILDWSSFLLSSSAFWYSWTEMLSVLKMTSERLLLCFKLSLQSGVVHCLLKLRRYVF